MKKFLLILGLIGVLAGAYYGIRLLPLFTTDNAGGDKVVLLHGYGRTETAMLLMESALTEAGFDVHSIGYPSTEESPGELLAIVSDKIGECCQNTTQTMHFVGHSLGGLLIRAYLAQSRPADLGRIVMLGTPNKGSELADIRDYELVPETFVEKAGPTAAALRTGPGGFAASLPEPDFEVGIIAGTRDNPVTNQWLPAPNDGMVSVESARLDGMSDFITIEVSHFELRSNREAARQTIEFLNNGRFDHGDE